MLRNLEIVPSTESRSELLEWVNSSMPVEAPNRNKVPAMKKVEECGHGVPYVMLLPTMLPIIFTPLLTSRVKVPAKTDYEAAANLKIMQDALRRNGIVVPEVLQHDSQRLINGNFQANLQLLQWFRGLYIALQECGIEAGEGRVVLETASAGDSLSSISSPPNAVIRAEDRRKSETNQISKAEVPFLREVRDADTQGAAATAAALAVLRESTSRPRDRSDSHLSSKRGSSTLHSTPVNSHRVHQQQTSAKGKRPQQLAHRQTVSRLPPASPPPAPEEEEPSPAPAKAASPPPSVEERAPVVQERRAQPHQQIRAPGTAAAAAPAVSQPQPSRIAEHPSSAPQRAAVPSPAEPAPAEPAQATTSITAATTATAATPTSATTPLHRKPRTPRRTSAPSGAGRTGSGNTPRRTGGRATPRTETQTPSTGRKAVVFKSMPARVNGGPAAGGARRRTTTSGSGGTPRMTEGSSATTTAATTTRNNESARTGATTPKQAGTGRQTTPRANGTGSPRQKGRKAAPAALLQSDIEATLPADEDPAPLPTAVAVAVPPANESYDAAPAPAAEEAPFQAAPPAIAEETAPARAADDTEVLQLKIDRQFYYDKLRAIEELVDQLEAKKKHEREVDESAWDAKDTEMMDFTDAVRCVLYAES